MTADLPQSPISKHCCLKQASGGLRQRRPKFDMMDLTFVGNAAQLLAANISASPLGVDYTVLDSIGSGSSGVVYKATRQLDGAVVALKTMHTLDEEMAQNRRAEYDILSELSHPHIVKVFDFFVVRDQAVLVMEFVHGTTLNRAVKSSDGGVFPDETSRLLFRSLLQAIDYLHSKRIVHRDVKSENCLVSHALDDLKLADFNSACSLMNGGSLTMTGTMDYAAPEVLKGESPSEANDIWSAGICLHLMLVGHLPQQGAVFRDRASFAEAVSLQPAELSGQKWEGVSPSCKDVLQLCLEPVKSLRPAAMTLLQKDWLADLTLDVQAPPDTAPLSPLSPVQLASVERRRKHKLAVQRVPSLS
eukprot:gb/GFBE01077458.1/.p1 GENE.gb/GFBE01077458.1/~~gb/GFBE01077458.1/.p1  ORF type:complete len:360 (+),score=52.19 gb/GFBE01077458.1/:1-1080(+)